MDRYLFVRAASLYIAVVMTAMVWAWRRPPTRALQAALLAFIWNVPALLVLHLGAARYGWWRFDAQGGLLLGMPVDLLLSWAWLWGAIPALAFPSTSIRVVVLAALTTDLVLMPLAAPVVQLGPAWLVGEALGLVGGLVPGQLLARWTIHDTHLGGRALLQVLAFSPLMVLVLPAIAIDGSGGAWTRPMTRPGWQLSLIVQLLAIPAVLGLTAVQEFVTRGGGTPVPFDPPRQIVTTGIYAYVRNPMQLSAVLLLALLGLVLRNVWVSAAGVMAHIYSTGLAGWDEDEDLTQRFGERWIEYRRRVRRWVPRARPWFSPDHPPARLFVSERCAMCSEVGRWLERRGVRHLTIVAADTHASNRLQRITYAPTDGSRTASGVEAVARALEHIHLGWALVGFLLRLPIVSQLSQLLTDASGGGPRSAAIGAEPSTETARDRVRDDSASRCDLT
jgi:protein-S-isoprenylcysteine O-methyltransferase Ste14